ncbi:DUF4394 domain-containing protein [Hymenobacter rigui]|nr:DUF4394 domain-containing protein [Hymenobacter rigui]
MKLTPHSTKASLCTAALGLAAVVLPLFSAHGQTVYALSSDVGLGTTTLPPTTNAALVTFSLGALTPSPSAAIRVSTRTPITGVASAQYLTGLAFRPATGGLYAIGYNPVAQQVQLYTIHPSTAAASTVGPALTLYLGDDIGRIGFTFNPVTDVIRITSGTGRNLRVNPNDGTLLANDATLDYTSTDVNAGRSFTIGSSAYTNSYTGTTSTTLYNLDEKNDLLTIQAPANDGFLTTVGALNAYVGALHTPADLDIYFDPVANTNAAYVSIGEPNYGSLYSYLYKLDLSSGALSLTGRVSSPGNGEVITDIAIANVASVTSTRTATLVTSFSLYPNPVTNATQISFRLPRTGQTKWVLTDALGRTVEHREVGLLPAGAHTLPWQPATHRAGVYFLRLNVDGQHAGIQRLVIQ